MPIYSNNFFWRTWDKKEIDWVEMRDGKLFGYEFKWNSKTKSKNKKYWLESYANEAVFEIINQDNFIGFVA